MAKAKGRKVPPELPPHQQHHTRHIIELGGPDACFICGDTHDVRRGTMNGVPSQLCGDCIEIQRHAYGSVFVPD